MQTYYYKMQKCVFRIFVCCCNLKIKELQPDQACNKLSKVNDAFMKFLGTPNNKKQNIFSVMIILYNICLYICFCFSNSPFMKFLESKIAGHDDSMCGVLYGIGKGYSKHFFVRFIKANSHK